MVVSSRISGVVCCPLSEVYEHICCSTLVFWRFVLIMLIDMFISYITDISVSGREYFEC